MCGEEEDNAEGRTKLFIGERENKGSNGWIDYRDEGQIYYLRLANYKDTRIVM